MLLLNSLIKYGERNTLADGKNTVRDVAAYILEWFASRGENSITSWKLQKLVYYCQAWSLVWDEDPLFPEQIQAWADGPVCPDLYREHRRKFRIGPGDINGNSGEFSPKPAGNYRGCP